MICLLPSYGLELHSQISFLDFFFILALSSETHHSVLIYDYLFWKISKKKEELEKYKNPTGIYLSFFLSFFLVSFISCSAELHSIFKFWDSHVLNSFYWERIWKSVSIYEGGHFLYRGSEKKTFICPIFGTSETFSGTKERFMEHQIIYISTTKVLMGLPIPYIHTSSSHPMK